MEYININEEVESWKNNRAFEKQRERDFRDGYMRGFKMATKIAEKKNLDMIFGSLDEGLLNEMIAYAEKDKTEVKK
jgi:hypothetical protein